MTDLPSVPTTIAPFGLESLIPEMLPEATNNAHRINIGFSYFSHFANVNYEGLSHGFQFIKLLDVRIMVKVLGNSSTVAATFK